LASVAVYSVNAEKAVRLRALTPRRFIAIKKGGNYAEAQVKAFI
jgi:hypothetical protein